MLAEFSVYPSAETRISGDVATMVELVVSVEHQSERAAS